MSQTENLVNFSYPALNKPVNTPQADSCFAGRWLFNIFTIGHDYRRAGVRLMAQKRFDLIHARRQDRHAPAAI